MYERTIAAYQRIYQISIPTEPTLVWDLLSTADKIDYNLVINSTDLTGNESCPSERIVVDGYVVAPSVAISVGTSETGAFEPVPVNCQYTFPVWDWVKRTYIQGSGGTAYVRIFFS